MILKHDSGLWQRLVAQDLVAIGGPKMFLGMGPVDVIYSDPPWSPGNEKWWRRHAKFDPPKDYTNLLRAWCTCASQCGALHVFVEQSIIDAHRQMLLDTVDDCASWSLPLIESWVTKYGSPKRENMLLHFGDERLDADPSGLSGVTMTKTVIDALGLPPGATIGDPCAGFGMVSRLSHHAGYNFIGTELNQVRLDRAIGWLHRKGYR